MEFIERIITDVTGVEVEALAFDYDSTTDLFYVPCLFNNTLAYFKLTENGSHITIYADEIELLEKMGMILYSEKNKKSFAYINDLYDFNAKTQYTMFKYKLEVVSDEKYYKELTKEIREVKERIKGR